jgi:hypothetical protein
MLGAVLLVAFMTAAGCGKRLSADDCERFADHLVDLTVQQMTGLLPPARPGLTPPVEAAKQAVQSQRGTFLAQCTSGMPRAAYDCLMRADSVSAMSSCAAAK